MQNYMVAFNPPRRLDGQLRVAFHKTFNKHIDIINLHLTLLPPFSLRNKGQEADLMKGVKKFEFTYPNLTFGQAGLFKNPDRTILYVPILPEKPFQSLHKKMVSLFEKVIEFETTAYPDNQVPPFIPHISLDYGFIFSEDILSKLDTNLPKISFTLIGPRLFLKKLLNLKSRPILIIKCPLLFLIFLWIMVILSQKNF